MRRQRLIAEVERATGINEPQIRQLVHRFYGTVATAVALRVSKRIELMSQTRNRDAFKDPVTAALWTTVAL